MRLAVIVVVALLSTGCWNLDDALRERDRKAAVQEPLIDVRIAGCGAAEASGTIQNRNAEATRVSIVIWWTLGGGEPLRTGVAHASPIGAGETQEWTSAVTGGPPLDAETAADVECHVESIAVFPF
jgi:hypothetical protein